MTSFADALDQEIVVLDGGLATQLEEQGHDLRNSLWSARLLRDEPDEIVAAHRAYVEAGADVAITASYHASYTGFANAGIDADEATRLLALSVDLARRAQPADRQTFVAGSVGLYGVVWANGTEYTGDYSRATDDDVATEQRRRIRAMVDAEADLLAIETIPSGREAAILGELLTEVPGIESWVTFCCRDDHHLSDGTPISEAVRAVTRTGLVTAVGVNCTPPQHVESLLADARTATDLPLVVYPNGDASGMVRRTNGSKAPVSSSSPRTCLTGGTTPARASSAVAAVSVREGSQESPLGARRGDQPP